MTVEILTADNARDGADIEGLVRAFEDAGRDGGRGDKCWYARDLQILLGYKRWDSFEEVVERAVTACRQAGHDPHDHFRRVPKMVKVGSGAERDIGDIEMDRYACYLAAQNASSRLRPVAIAQTYFAIQTRRQEVADENGVDFEKLSAVQRRLYLRDQVNTENKKLFGTAQAAGVKGKDFGKFNNRGYQGLYGERGVDEIRAYKDLGPKAAILDHMDSTELAANLFRITQTDEKLRRERIKGSNAACEAHYEVGQKVRATMLELSGTFPEDLPSAPDVKKLAAEERRDQRKRLMEPLVQAAIEAPALDQPIESGRQVIAIDLNADLWKYALLIMSVQPGQQISTAALIAELPAYIHVSEDQAAPNSSRKDSKFSQIVRNLKSHRTTRTNFIARGLAEDVPGGFRITPRGLDFVRAYFAVT